MMENVREDKVVCKAYKDKPLMQWAFSAGLEIIGNVRKWEKGDTL